MKLVILETFAEDNAYRREGRAAGEEVIMRGAIYEEEAVQALRFRPLAKMHGHTVGGTIPALVEALSAGSPVIAHDNVHDRWTAGAVGLFWLTTKRDFPKIDTAIKGYALAA